MDIIIDIVMTAIIVFGAGWVGLLLLMAIAVLIDDYRRNNDEH